ncbi:MAG: oligosaccharide flippase family protein [Granulosicoccus sp.]
MNIPAPLRGILPSGLFARGVTILAGSNALGQLIALAASPILTRLYSPADFGLLAIYMALTTVFGVVVCLRYELAIPLPVLDTEGLSVALIALGFVLTNSVLSVAGVWWWREEIAVFFNMPTLSTVLWMFPFSLLLLGSFTVFRYWSVREKAFPAIGVARLQQVLSSITVQITGASFGATALIGGQLANQGVGSISLGRRMLSHPELNSITTHGLIRIAKRFRRFPLITTWAALLNRGSAQLPTMMFAALFGPVVAGLYALSMRVINVPAGVMSDALGSVFLSSAVDAARQSTLEELTRNTYERLVIVTLPPLALVAAIAPEIFGWVFGAEWRAAGEFAQWIVILVYFAIVASPLTLLFVVLEKQTHDFVFQLLLFITRVSTIYLGAIYGDALLAIALYAVGSGVCYMLFLGWVAFQLNQGLKMILAPMIRALGVAVVVVSPVIIVNIVPIKGAVGYFFGVLFSVMLVLFYLFRVVRKEF